MSALLESLAMKYGMNKAMQLLGIDKQQENPKYAISLGGMNLNPMNMLKRAGLNQGIKSIMKGGFSGAMLPMLGIGALAYGMNKAFPMSRQDKLYSSFSANKMGDPYGYASQMISGSGAGKDPFGINTVSAFGNYGKYQQNLYNKLSKKDNLSNFDKARMDLADEVTQSIKEDYISNQYNNNNNKQTKSKSKNKSSYSRPNMKDIAGGGGGGDGGGGGGGSPGSAGPGGSDAMGSFRRGGIASL